MAPKVHMRNLLNCPKETLLQIHNLSIHEFMNTVDEVGTLFDVEVDEYTTEQFSAFEWFVMVVNYLGMEYATNEKIVHYLQFADKLNGIHSDKPMYPTVLFHENETTRNEVLMGAYNFYHLMKTDMENLIENRINV